MSDVGFKARHNPLKLREDFLRLSTPLHGEHIISVICHSSVFQAITINKKVKNSAFPLHEGPAPFYSFYTCHSQTSFCWNLVLSFTAASSCHCSIGYFNSKIGIVAPSGPERVRRVWSISSVYLLYGKLDFEPGIHFQEPRLSLGKFLSIVKKTPSSHLLTLMLEVSNKFCWLKISCMWSTFNCNDKGNSTDPNILNI